MPARCCAASGPATQGMIDFAVPHTLSLTFVPKWVKALEAGFGPIVARLMALNVHDAVMTIVEGGCDLLLCYHHPRQPVQLDASRYDMLVLGQETLRPYARCDRAGTPDFMLPGDIRAPLPFLSYTSNAYLGRMVDLILADAGRAPYLVKRYETDMAEGLKMMALEGHGVAFLPESAVSREIKESPAGAAPTAAGRNGKCKWKSGCTANGRPRSVRARRSLPGCGTICCNRRWIKPAGKRTPA